MATLAYTYTVLNEKSSIPNIDPYGTPQLTIWELD